MLGEPPVFSLESTLNTKTSPTAFMFEAIESVPKVISPPVTVTSPAKIALPDVSKVNWSEPSESSVPFLNFKLTPSVSITASFVPDLSKNNVGWPPLIVVGHLLSLFDHC
jgi:hypothetical protein